MRTFPLLRGGEYEINDFKILTNVEMRCSTVQSYPSPMTELPMITDLLPHATHFCKTMTIIYHWPSTIARPKSKHLIVAIDIINLSE